jgi:transposase
MLYSLKQQGGFIMNSRLYPVSETFFNEHINPLITSSYSRAGRPRIVSHYQVFSALLYVLRTGISWRDLPECYGYWHTVYLRFKKGSDRGLWWNIIIQLQQHKKITMNIVLADSTTVKVHRHGGGLKGGSKAKE